MKHWLKVCCLLSVLILINAQNEEVEPCPKKCSCTKIAVIQKAKVDCTREMLESIPPIGSWPSNTYELDISMNNIKRIDVMESMDELEVLNLATNDIESIEPGSFSHVPNLVSLDLSHNELIDLPYNIFDHLNNLVTLNLSYNNIQILPNELLAKTTQLQELRIAHNPLKILNTEFFEHSMQLKVLDLSRIEAFSLKEGLFNMLSELIEIDLSDNEFLSVPTFALRSARKLKILTFNSNPIRSLDEHSFMGLKTLEELYLNDMRELIEIKEKSFSSLIYLKKISIANNPHLSHLDKNAFIGIYNTTHCPLQEVDIRANRLSKLSERTLPWCHIETLDLRENPWTCDCNLQWLKHCNLRPELNIIICTNPSKLRGKELNTIEKEEMVCEHHEIYREVKMMRLFVIVFASIVLFFMGLIFVLFIKRDQVQRWWNNRRRGDGAIYYVKAHSNPIDPDM